MFISRGSSSESRSSNRAAVDRMYSTQQCARRGKTNAHEQCSAACRGLACFVLLLIIVVGPASQDASGQSVLNFKRIINNWPTIELYFVDSCNGVRAHFDDSTHFKVYENGLEIKDINLWCPDLQGRCAFSASLVFDNSASMNGSGITGAITAGNAFVSLMDSVSDEASVLIFNSSVSVRQEMTTSKSMLRAAVSSMTPQGSTALWDGIYAGLQELIANGANQCRGVVVLTDGSDNASTRTPSEVMSLAVRNRIRVFTVCLGASIDGVLLQAIADQTGGKYYQTATTAPLVQIYTEIFQFISTPAWDCVISYQATCMDGGLRTVELQVNDFCNGSTSSTKSYQAPLDTATLAPLAIQAGSKVASGSATVRIPINLVDTVINRILYPSTFNLVFDEGCFQFHSISTKGTALEGVPVTVTPFTGGVTVATADQAILNGSLRLFELTFRASDPEGVDTVCCPIRMEDWVFEAGCFRPVLKGGEICIVPRQPKIICQMSAPSELTWVSSSENYSPNPFTVSMLLSNLGDREARNVRYTITVNQDDLTLVAPASSIQNGNPLHVEPSDLNEVRWDLRAKRRTRGDSILVCIKASFDNHPDVTCCRKMWVPPADASLTCTATAPTISVDSVNVRYNPMPFEVTVQVRNDGTVASDTVRVQLTLPGALQFVSPDSASRAVKLAVPPVLPPGTSAYATWRLEHAIVQSSQTYTLTSSILHRNRTAAECTTQLVIPALLPPLAVSITPDGPTTFCEGGAVVLDAGSGYSTYQWSSGAQSQKITVRSSGSYSVHVTDVQGRGATSPPVIVTVHAPPAPKLVVIGGDPSICPGDTIEVDAGADYAEYLWSTGATTRMLRVAQGGLWWVTVRTAEGCTATSDSVTTLVQPKPPVPVITQTDKVLTTTLAGYQYQWYRNGVAIAGATNQFHILTENGTYTLVITNQYGCTSVSIPFDVTTVAAGSLPVAAPFTVACHPNPVTSDLDVRIEGEVAVPLTLTLVDATGRVHRTLRDLEPGAHMTHRISMHAAPPGVYFIIAATKDAIQISKFMKVE